jgi:hypothetical protein
VASFVVLEPPRAAGGEPGEETVFLRDGFSFLAVIVPVIWLLWHRLWLEAVCTLAAALVIAVAGQVAGFGLFGTMLSLLVSFYVAIEGNGMRLARYRRLGWREMALIDADNRHDAEARYFSRGQAEPAAAGRSASLPPVGVPEARGPALGLLDYPGR